MENQANGGFEAYVYPKWSTIVGWFIFAGCIIPIPLVYIVNYIKEYQNIGLKDIVRWSFFKVLLLFLLKIK